MDKFPDSFTPKGDTTEIAFDKIKKELVRNLRSFQNLHIHKKSLPLHRLDLIRAFFEEIKKEFPKYKITFLSGGTHIFTICEKEVGFHTNNTRKEIFDYFSLNPSVKSKKFTFNVDGVSKDELMKSELEKLGWAVTIQKDLVYSSISDQTDLKKLADIIDFYNSTINVIKPGWF